MGKKYRHITLSDRRLIQTQLQQGFSPAGIAESLGRHRSSIAQELARNGWKPPPTVGSVGYPPLAGGYPSSQANQCSERLASIARVKPKLIIGNPLERYSSDLMCICAAH